MGIGSSLHACAKRSMHHFIGLGFWQAWQMIVLCTDAITPSTASGEGLKSLILAATTFGYLIVICASAIRPSCVESRAALASAGGTMASGTFLFMVASYVSDPIIQAVALALSCALIAWGNAALVIMWGELWKTLATGRVGQHLYLSYAFAFVLFFVAVALPHPLDGVFVSLFPLASCAILRSCESEPRRRLASRPVQSGSLPVAQLLAFLFVLSLLWGVSQKITPSFSDHATSTHFLAESMFVAGIAIGAFAAKLALDQPESESIALFQPVAPAMAIGIMTLALLPPEFAFIGNGLLTMGVYCLDMFLMLTATDLAYRTRKSTALVFGGAIVVTRIGTTIGSFCASSMASVLLENDVRLALAVVSLGVIVLASTLVFTKADLLAIYQTVVLPAGASEDAAETDNEGAPASASQGAQSAERVPRPAIQPTLEKRCLATAERAGLTARETEVLELLVRGRTVQNICDELTIAKGTAKHHVSNIYRKLGVGDRRSLYDVVDAAGMQL